MSHRGPDLFTSWPSRTEVDSLIIPNMTKFNHVMKALRGYIVKFPLGLLCPQYKLKEDSVSMGSNRLSKASLPTLRICSNA